MSYVMLGGLSREQHAAVVERYTALREAIVEANGPRWFWTVPPFYGRVISATTLSNNLTRLDAQYNRVLAGNYDGVAALEQTANAILAALQDVPEITDLRVLLRELMEIVFTIPRAAFGLAAEGAGEVARGMRNVVDQGARGLGIDLSKVGGVLDAVPWVVGGGLLIWLLTRDR